MIDLGCLLLGDSGFVDLIVVYDQPPDNVSLWHIQDRTDEKESTQAMLKLICINNWLSFVNMDPQHGLHIPPCAHRQLSRLHTHTSFNVQENNPIIRVERRSLLVCNLGSNSKLSNCRELDYMGRQCKERGTCLV